MSTTQAKAPAKTYASTSGSGDGVRTSRKSFADNKGLLVLDQAEFVKWSKRDYTTPEMIWAGFCVITFFTVIFCIYSMNALDRSYDQFHTVCVDSAPSVELAQRIRGNLSDLEASEINLLLLQSGPEFDALQAKAESTRQQIAEELVSASQNIKASNKAEKPDITNIVRDYAAYESLIYSAGSLYTPGADKGECLKLERQAAQFLSQHLLHDADDLDKANSVELDNAYTSSQDDFVRDLLFLWVFGGGVAGILVVFQFWLYARTNRIFNPGLVLATASLVGSILYTNSALFSASHMMKSATKDCFLSIHVLLQAKAFANDAYAAQSRWLFDPEKRGNSLAVFDYDSLQVFNPGNWPYSAAVNSYQQNQRPLGVRGTLADELDNITFIGEEDAAIASLATWGNYQDVFQKVMTQTLIDQASGVKLALGAGPNSAKGAFENFSRNLDHTLQINLDQFEISRAAGFRALSYSEPFCVLGMAAVIGFSFIGIWPRLKEYRY